MRLPKLQLNWRHALGELIIVVVGVFLALAADDWRQARADRATEYQYVQRLIADLKSDDTAIATIMSATEQRARYAQVILSAYDSGQRLGSPADFVKAVEYGDYFSYPTYSKATIDDLMSTGNLRLIRSTEVKEALNRYYATIDWTEQFGDLWRPTQLALLKLIPDFLDLKTRYALFQEGFQSSCGPTLSCDEGIPWASSELSVSDADADRILRRLLAKPEARALYANMARIQGSHYADLASIRRAADHALLLMQQYTKENW